MYVTLLALLEVKLSVRVWVKVSYSPQLLFAFYLLTVRTSAGLFSPMAEYWSVYFCVVTSDCFVR